MVEVTRSSEPEMAPAASEEVIIDPLLDPMPQQAPQAGMTFEPQALPPPAPYQQVEVEQVNMERPGT